MQMVSYPRKPSEISHAPYAFTSIKKKTTSLNLKQGSQPIDLEVLNIDSPLRIESFPPNLQVFLILRSFLKRVKSETSHTYL